jgi:hypothetical protein
MCSVPYLPLVRNISHVSLYQICGLVELARVAGQTAVSTAVGSNIFTAFCTTSLGLLANTLRSIDRTNI